MRGMLFLLVARGAKRTVPERIFSGANLPAARARANRGLLWLMKRAAAPPSRLAG
jgi:hypothetical protein